MNILPFSLVFAVFCDAASVVNSALHTAVEEGDFELVQALLASPGFDDPTLHNGDLLMVACDQPQVQIFRILLDDPRLDMEKAASKVIDKLFKDISATNAESKFTLAKLLASEPKFPVHANEDTMLHNAVRWGQCDLVETLLADPRCYPKSVFLSNLFNYEEYVSPRCVFALVQNKWFDPSVLKNRMMGQLYNHQIIAKFVSVEDLNATRLYLLENNGFNPTIFPFLTLPDDGLLSTRLIEALPQMPSRNHFVSICKKAEDLDALLSLDLDAINEEDLNIMLVASASSGNIRATRYLLSHGTATLIRFNFMAIRFAAAFGHFELAEELLNDSRVGLGSVSEQFIYKVFRHEYMGCFKSNSYDEDDVSRNINGIRYLFDLPRAPQWAQNYNCQRMKLHFDSTVKSKKTLSEFFHERVSKLACMTLNLHRYSFNEVCLLQIYGTFIRTVFIYLVHSDQAMDMEGEAFLYAEGFDGLLQSVGLMVEPQQYESEYPEMTFTRLFHRHYDRMKAAGASREDATEYAIQRISKDQYHKRRAQPAAFDNATEESTHVLVRRNDFPVYVKPISWAYKELLSRFGNWLCCLDEDFSSFAWGTESLPKPIDKILRERLKYSSRTQAFKNLVSSHPGYIQYYDPVDWKQVHGFLSVNEFGDGSVVTVIDGFVNCRIPNSLAPSVAHAIIESRPSGTNSHGIQVASIISHPIFGVSPAIQLRLVNSIVMDQFYLNNLVPGDLHSAEEVSDVLDNITLRLPDPIRLQIGDIVNASVGDIGVATWSPELTLNTRMIATFLYTIIKGTGCIVVNSAGNAGSMSRLGFWIPKILSRNKHARDLYIQTTSLLDDGLHLSPYTDQPGDDEYVQDCTISAIGTNVSTLKIIDTVDENGQLVSVDQGSEEISGTSFSAPMVSAAAALVLSHIRRLHPEEQEPHKLTVKSLLQSATPIVLMVTSVEERKRMQRMLEFQTPVLLEGMMSKDLKPMKGYKAMLAGEEKIFDITEDMINEMKRRYGHGRLNVQAALQWVDEYYRGNINNMTAPQP